MRSETDGEDAAAAERRALERAAYGRDGGLDAAAARRLQELQEGHRRRTPFTQDERTESSSVGDDPPEDVTARRAPENVPAAEDTPPAAPDDVSRTEARAANRRGLVPVLVASAALLAIGVGAGWALFAPRPDAFPLTEAQEERRIALAGEGYDPGSVRPVAEAEGALAWFATQDDGASRCLILDVDKDSQSTCLAEEEVGPGLYASLPVPTSAADDEEDSFSFEGVTAVMLFSTADEPMVSIQRWGGGSTLVAQFGEAERARAEELVGDGYDLNLSVLGSFREQPVWLGERRAESGAAERCLIVDADGSRQCATVDEAVQSGLRVQLLDVDQETGELLSASVIEVDFTRWQTPYLTVTSGPAVVDEATGESYLVTTGPPGDPIRVDIPGRESED
ncbi:MULTISPECIES: hypothetical protein [unclassified Microbacterium]|uniref:hypothetical protein n=1 Tax=unclassified Microbacterium TaxID=2609290 RepID=UPI0008F53885|nr:hypothetical protein [Microbacterium sp. LCT-H2]OIJ34065.1 hypothetical protein BK819_00715 [Microbacterium sp. LCT-H2]